MALSTLLDVSGKKPWLKRAGLIAIPAILSRKQRGAGLSRLWILGAFSLLGFGLRKLSRTKSLQTRSPQTGTSRWKLPQVSSVMPEEFAASAASGR
jgi:hypothetical protein